MNSQEGQDAPHPERPGAGAAVPAAPAPSRVIEPGRGVQLGPGPINAVC